MTARTRDPPHLPHTARHVKGLAPMAGPFARIADGHLGPATTSCPVTPRRIGGRHPATSITSIMLSYGRGEAKRSPTRSNARWLIFKRVHSGGSRLVDTWN